jgi:hypothetical protein
MHQFFGRRNLGDVSPADRLWLMKEIKKLHNGFTNAMLVDTSRNQWHIWLNLLLAMGFTRTTSAPRSVALGKLASLALRRAATPAW